MATYTPNFNLSKPDLSDPFGDFRQSYNDNMDTIDLNLGGGGGSSTLGGLDDVDIQTPTDGQALVYDANTQEWINAYISGGGGGGSISYGYAPPQNPSTDGSLYYLLNAIDKKLGEFLYITDHWALVWGTSFTKGLTLLARKAQRNYGEGATVYAVTQTSRLLCINININSSADTQTLTSTISGGTLVDSVELQTNYGNSIRNHVSNVSLIDADNGDSITLANVSNGSYVVQLHAIFEVFGLDTITDINVYDYLIKTDGDMGLSKTFNLSGLYLLICLESSGNNGTDMGVDITYDGEDYTAEYVYEHGIFACKVMIVDANVANTITFKWENKSSFVSRGYFIYSLSE